MGNLRSVSLALTVAVLGLSLASCDNGSQAAKDAADLVSKALSALDVSQAPLTGSAPAAAQTQLKAIVEGLGDVKPAVSAGQPSTANGTTTVPLDFRWQLAGREWKYTTTAQVAQDNGHWAVRWSPAMLAPGLGDSEVLVAESRAPARADILGAGDAKLVTSRPVLRVGIDKTQVIPELQDASARALAAVLGLDPADYAKQVASAGSKAFVEGLILRDVPDRTPTDAQITAVSGAVVLKDTLPLAPTRNFARAVLGTVGQATAEQVQKANGALEAGDVTGTGGLEEQYDGELRGQEGVTVYAVPAGGGGSSPSPSASAKAAPTPSARASKDARRPIFDAPPVPGAPLKTTLDPRLQQLADDVLANVGPASALVAIRPSDGAVLAAASGPGSRGYNTAMLGQYAPGSIFKTVDSLALLRQGATPELQVDCTPTLTVDGKTFQNAEGYPSGSLGKITLRDAYAHSCNTAFIAQRDKVSQAQLQQTAASLGVGVDANTLGAAGFLGTVPADATGTEHAASMIGQGKILMSPLAATVMAASVVKGDRVSPRLVLDAGGPGQHATPSVSATAGASASATATASPSSPAQPINAAEAGTLRDMMRAVVTSGHAGFLLSVPGEPVGAKTGTAEFGSDSPPKTHAWIIGTHGDLAVAVFVEEGGLGATVSGPILTDFLKKASQ